MNGVNTGGSSLTDQHKKAEADTVITRDANGRIVTVTKAKPGERHSAILQNNNNSGADGSIPL